MKILLSSAIVFFSALSANLIANPAPQIYSDEHNCYENNRFDFYIYIHQKMKEINTQLMRYELDGDTHNVNFDYHVGYLNGQYAAYRNLENHFNQNAPH